MRLWPWKRPALATSRRSYSISDPAIVSLLGYGTPSYAGVEIGENSALGISAVYRAVSLISGSLAALPLQTIRTAPDGTREVVSSVFDTPGGPDGLTTYEWVETVLLHLLLHGNAFLLHQRGGAGQMAGLLPVHPLAVSVDQQPYWPDGMPVIGGKIFHVTMLDGRVEDHDGSTLTHIPGQSLDGIRGLSPIAIARNSLGTAAAGDRAAAAMFSNGSLISGLVSVDGEDVDEDDAKVIKEALERRTAGYENAGAIRFINRKLKFTPWTMTSSDAQFLESRSFQIEEIARWYGVPPHLLMQTDKQTSWGTGVEVQNRAMGRTVLAPWAIRIEQRLSRLLRGDRSVRFDFTGLERPTPETEIELIARKVEAKLITRNEARQLMNLPPLPGGDMIMEDGAGTVPAPVAEGVPA